MVYREFVPGRTYVGRVPFGVDLKEYLENFVRDRQITAATISGIGATTATRLGYYDQTQREYRSIAFEKEMEIVSLLGTVSVQDGKPMVHVHLAVGDESGRVFGGHLMPGTKVFTAEFVVNVFEGEPLTRRLDEATGLYLWSDATAP